ncbi:hypothetical protein C1646_675602 [Rhizophagus diaphanus]|nr:hypothetical protein C1646_675602 [Rhizophagus diaphanus] [Rhizophagus sp. MUCL 43196]
MSGNYARRGSGNLNSRKSSRQEKKAHKNSKYSDNSSSDKLQDTIQKRFHIINKDTMDEDFIADVTANASLDENTQAFSPNNSTAPSASSCNTSSGVDTSIHALFNKENNLSPNTSPNMDTDSGLPPNQATDPTPTITINRQDYQAAAAPNSATEILKKFPTNKALIDAINNLFLETYESYTGHAKMTGSGDAKYLIIYLQFIKARDACCNGTHAKFPDLLFHPHDPRQLQSAEDLQAIQVTDIPFFITKSQLEAYFRKYSNIVSCRMYSRKGAKMQQARIVFNHADSILRFTDQ